ncbi:MAG: metallophosphoesterase [Candidatus Aminicenantes bacterium]|nr:MAG: metallophosphoesterase [Candidatus Aminicenantes bacterium]
MIVVTIISLVILAVLYKAFTIDLTFSRRQKIILLLLLLGGVLFLIVSSPGSVFSSLVGTGKIWEGVFGLAFTHYIICSVVSLLFSKYRQQIVFGTFVVLILTSFYSIFNGLRLPMVKEIHLAMAKLPEELNGFTIVQLSDLHLGGVAKPEWLEQVVKKINALHPHLVVITGDLIEENGWNENGKPYAEALKKLKSIHGVYAVSGNHDVYEGGKNFSGITKEAGITLLNNQTVTVAGGIQLAGICDPHGKAYNRPGADIDKALKNIDPSLPVIFLSHRPEYFKVAMEYGIDLQLSGHTHAGQIPPMDLLVMLGYHYPYGLYQEGDSYIYTSCGTSVLKVPMRLFSRNEIVKIVLTR